MVVIHSFIRRIEESNVAGVAPQLCSHGASDNRGLPGQAETGQVFAKNLKSRGVAFNQYGVARAAAQRFDANGASPRISIQENGAFDAGCENVEERLS